MFRNVQPRGIRRKAATGVAVLIMTAVAAVVAVSPAQASTHTTTSLSHSSPSHPLGRTWLR